jgi:CRISPR-associated protein Cas2
MIFGEFKAMWLMVMFDMPTDTDYQKREYLRFRKMLLRNGFHMMQYSVYARPCPTMDHLNKHRLRVEKNLPQDGEIRILPFTDYQFGKMKVYYQRKRKKVEQSPEELVLF